MPSLIINRLLLSPPTPSTHVFTAVKTVGTLPSAPHTKHPVKPTRPPTLSPVKQPTRRPSMTIVKPPSASPVKLPTGRPLKQPVRRPAPPPSNFAGTPSPLNVPIQSSNGGPLPPFTCPPVSGTSRWAPGNATRCQHLSDCNGVFTSSGKHVETYRVPTIGSLSDHVTVFLHDVPRPVLLQLAHMCLRAVKG